MANVQHNTLGNSPLESHGIFWQTVANAAALVALIVAAGDVSQGKTVKQTDTGQVWLVTSVAPTFQLLNPVAVSNTADGLTPAITAANAFLQSNGGGTAATWVTASGGGTPVGTGRTISTTAPLTGGGDLSANRTFAVNAISNVSSGVAPQVPGTVGLALTSTATASTWGVDFGANTPTTTVGWTANASGGFFRAGLAPGSGAGSGAATGSIRLPNGNFVGTVQGRNAGDTTDFILLGWSSSGLDTQVGSNASGANNTITASGITAFRVRLTTSATVTFQVTTTAITTSGIATFTFDGVPTVTISQAVAAAAGKTFSLVAQAGATTGGDLVLAGGGAAAANAGGSVQLVPGKTSGLAGNINLGKATTPIWNGLQRGIFVSDAEAIATAAPVGGSYVYGFGGGGTARSPTNTYSALWANSVTAGTTGIITNYPKCDNAALAAGTAVTTIVSWDMSAPGFGLPAIDNAQIRIQATMVIAGNAGSGGSIDLRADFKRIAGVLSQVGVTTTTYTNFDPAIAPAVVTLDATGTTIRLRGDASVGAGVPAANWSGQIYLSTSPF